MKNRFYKCYLTKKEDDMLKDNPHCISYFCYQDRILESKNIEDNTTEYTDVKSRFEEKFFSSFNYNRTFHLRDDITGTMNDYSDIIKSPLKSFKQNEDIFYTLKDINNLKHGFIYTPRQNLPVSALHLGQLKLFLSTLQFLLYYIPKDKDVHIIYPGSAVGDNLIPIMKYFPNTYWYLIDPNKFNKNLYTHPQVKFIRNSLFTDKLLYKFKEELKDKYTILISDIRFDPYEEQIDRDNILQKKWVEVLKPNYAQLKWRIPRDKKLYNYFDGDAYLQLYAPPSSTELRLVVEGKGKIKTKNWSFESVDDDMTYFNRVLRVSYYKTRVVHDNLDHCHDCVAFIKLLADYKEKYPENLFSKQSLNNMIEEILNEIDSVKYKIEKDYNENLKKLHTINK